MGDTGGAGCDGQDFISAGFSGLFHLGDFFRQLGYFELVYDIQELFLGLRGAERLGEIIIHQQDGQTGENLQMYVVFGVGSSDQEYQVDRLTVQGVIIDTIGNSHGCQAGGCDRVCLGVRDGDTVTDTGGILCFTGKDACSVALFVVDVALVVHQVDHLVDGILLVRGAAAQLNAFRLEQISDSHTFLLYFELLYVVRFRCPVPG